MLQLTEQKSLLGMLCRLCLLTHVHSQPTSLSFGFVCKRNVYSGLWHISAWSVWMCIFHSDWAHWKSLCYSQHLPACVYARNSEQYTWPFQLLACTEITLKKLADLLKLLFFMWSLFSGWNQIRNQMSDAGYILIFFALSKQNNSGVTLERKLKKKKTQPVALKCPSWGRGKVPEGSEWFLLTTDIKGKTLWDRSSSLSEPRKQILRQWKLSHATCNSRAYALNLSEGEQDQNSFSIMLSNVTKEKYHNLFFKTDTNQIILQVHSGS